MNAIQNGTKLGVKILTEPTFLTVFFELQVAAKKNSVGPAATRSVHKTFKMRSSIRQKKNQSDPTPSKKFLAAKLRIT